jgi:16S rRNA (adenine1518-N6/adenine1519-N6)-dimethyltransferase
MKLSNIRGTLESLGTQPTQSLGQNFLHDQNLAEWIVDQLGIGTGDPWVELGPGLGALTRFAARKSENGILVEKDGRLAGFLTGEYPGLEIVHGDALRFDVRDLFRRGPTCVFGNLPYYVSSQILFQFTAEPSPVRLLSFTLQKELAERLSAEPRTKAYGALTLLLGRRWRVKYLRTLPPSVFTPAPKVDSAVVLLSPRPVGELPDCDGNRFNRLVKLGFSQRRKQLRKMLAGEGLDWARLCSVLGVEETVRAEELSLAQWVRLTRFACGDSLEGEPAGQDVHGERFDVVNEKDEVVGVESRHVVHEKQLRHRAVHVFVFDRHGQIFLQKRSRWKDRCPGLWDSSAAGHVDSGEDYDNAARREVEEELGVETAVERLGRMEACPETGWEFVGLYRAEHGGPFRLPPAEIESGAFFSVDQITRWVEARPGDFAPGFLRCWSWYAERTSPEVAG